MNKPLLILVALIFCSTSKVFSQDIEVKNFNTFDAFLLEQNTKLSEVKNGFAEGDVFTTMGDTLMVKVPKVGRMKPLNMRFEQPYFVNHYKNTKGIKVKVLWYFSTPRDQNGSISKRECTPILLVENKVVGKGWEYFNNYRRTKGLRL